MRVAYLFLPAALVFSAARPLIGPAQAVEEASQPTWSSDRPTIGTGPDLAPLHWIVAEQGIGVAAPGGHLTVDAPETLLRYGAFKSVELRWSSPSIQRSIDSPGPSGGWQRQDASFGAKIHLPAPKAWPVSAVATLSVPIGSHGVSSGGWDPAITLAASHAWGPRIASYVSASFASVSGDGRGRENADQLSTITTWSFSNRTTGFVEFAPLLSRDPAISAYTTDSGLTRLIGKRIQLDARVGSTVDSAGAHPVAGIGLCFLFPSFQVSGNRMAANISGK